MPKELQIVGFQLGGQSFGLPITLVQEIVRRPEITHVPHAPEYLEGVMNLRGNIVPVIDLRRRFGSTAIADHRHHRVLVVNVNSHFFGLLVDSASEVLKLSPAQIESPPDLLAGDAIHYLSGMAQHQGRLILLVDPARILQAADLPSPHPVGPGDL